MAVETHLISVHTRGETVVVDLSANLEDVLESRSITNGSVTVFVQGSTCGASTTTFDPGLANEDIRATYDRRVPDSGCYAHNVSNETDNGYSDVGAFVTGPSIRVPLVNGKTTLGSAQQVVIVDFDTRPRRRDIFVQIMGESTSRPILDSQSRTGTNPNDVWNACVHEHPAPLSGASSMPPAGICPSQQLPRTPTNSVRLPLSRSSIPWYSKRWKIVLADAAMVPQPW